MKLNKIICASVLSFTFSVKSVPLLLTHEPLFLNQSVPPALAVTFDDSGSMAWGYMPDTQLYYYAASFASADYNLLYFNPNINYRPPVRSDGTSLPDADFDNAKFDGFYEAGNLVGGGITGRINLNNNYVPVFNSYPNYTNGTVGVFLLEGGVLNRGKAYYYTWNGPSNATIATRATAGVGTGQNQYTKHEISADQEQNFANWYSYYNTRGKLARAALSHAFVNFGPDFKIDWQQINNNRFSGSTGGTNMNLFTGSHRDDFFDWLFTIPANGGTPLRRSTELAGIQFEKKGVNGPYYDANFGAELSCQQNFHIAISDGTWNGAEGVDSNVDNTGTTFPAVSEGESGYNYNPGSGLSKMYAGTDSRTLADNAFEFWRRDLRPDLENRVPVFIEDFTDINGDIVSVSENEQWWQKPELFWNPNNDPASWQHLVSFNIGLGLSGALDQETDLLALRRGEKTWTRTGDSGGLVDDVWHASVNSRGKYFSARDPNELAESLNKVVSNIIQRKGRASAGSVSSNVVSDATLSFKTGYDTSDWSGFVIASPLNADGTLGAVEWDAGCKLTGGLCASMGRVIAATNDHYSRNISTFFNGNQYDFDATSLPTSAITPIISSEFVIENPTISYTDVINYIRGDRSLERFNNGVFRDRRSLLGDVIHSPAQIVRAPSASFDDEFWQPGTPEYNAASSGSGYEEFRETYKNRDNVILVGANDGMLHAFAAGIQNTTNGGHEYWAYIPSKSLETIAELADPIAPHKTRVDAAPFVRDAFIEGGWNTVALGNLRFGGKLFYALNLGSDVKNEPEVLWEFTDAEDSDMGYTYAGGIISRVYNPETGASKWVAFLPNGYSSSNQKSALYALDLETGALLHKWISNDGSIADPNGMGPPVVGDFVAYDSSDTSITYYAADQGADFIYAGDLHGNVYKFDALKVFSGGTTTISSDQILFSGSSDQAITTPPRIFTPDDSTTDVMITFGTGKYIETPDRSVTTTPPQYLIGLRDSFEGYSTYSLNDSRLVEQTVTETGTFRSVSSNPVASDESWKVELPTSGERMVNLIGRNNQSNIMTVITIIPNGADPCLPGGESWIMAISSTTGGSLSSGGFFNGGQSEGIFVDDLALGMNIITTPGGNNTLINIDTGAIDNTGESGLVEIPTRKWGRKSWQRIILD
ncbi:MAG: pilus assembly protein [Marinicellaceae bacterium]